MVQFTVPSRVEVTRESHERAMGWWMWLHSKHGIKLPKFVWEPSEHDTRLDLQTFWVTALGMSVKTGFSDEFMTTDTPLFVWLVHHSQGHTIRINVPMCFERMWTEHKLGGLDLLLHYYSLTEDGEEFFFDTIRNCMAAAGAERDMALLNL